jgi:hypothetical protein
VSCWPLLHRCLPARLLSHQAAAAGRVVIAVSVELPVRLETKPVVARLVGVALDAHLATVRDGARVARFTMVLAFDRAALPRSPVKAFAGLMIVVATACHGKQEEIMREGVIGVEASKAKRIWSIAHGSHWTLKVPLVANAQNQFLVPASDQWVTAFLDLNQNGTIDRFSEPSQPCRLDNQRWRCDIRSAVVTTHRVVSGQGESSKDTTMVFWEDYADDWQPKVQSRLCFASEDCTQLLPSPFGVHQSTAVAQVNMLSLCGKEGFEPKQGTGSANAYTVRQPVQLVANIASNTSSNGLEVKISPPTGNRYLVWLGESTIEGQVATVVWHSEQKVSEDKDGFVSVPKAAMDQCNQTPRCRVNVQVVNEETNHADGVTAISELRVVLEKSKP